MLPSGMPTHSTESSESARLELLRLALAGDDDRLSAFCEEALIADIADWMLDLEEDDVWRIWRVLDPESRAELLTSAGDTLRADLLEQLAPDELVLIVEELPADEAVDVLAEADEGVAEQVLRRIDFERAKGLRDLLHYPDDSIGGVMNTEIVSVRQGTRIGDAIKEIKSGEGPDIEEGQGVFVVDEHDRPVGWVADRELLKAGIHTVIDEVMDTDLVTVSAHEDQERAAQQLLKYDLDALPVVDDRGALIGVVDASDALAVFEEEVEEDILRLVGASAEDQTRLAILTRVRQRLPLMALTVAGGLGTARILAWAVPTGVSLGGASGPSYSDLLRYLPIIIGLAGNVGIQTSTILVRAFATGEVRVDRERAVLREEVAVGLLIGLLCGATAGLIAEWMEAAAPPGFGIALGLAISVAVTWASLLGSAVPILCRRMGFDPAIVAGPFLITVSDVSGAAIFIAVADFVLARHGG